MKFRCERDTLAEAVATAQRTVASRSGALPVLQDLRITATEQGLELVGSDLEITNRVRVPAEVEDQGVAVVPKLLGEIVRRLEPGPVTVVVTGDEAVITAGRFTTSLRLKPAEDYPRLASTEGEGVTVDAATFAGCAPSGRAGRVQGRSAPDPHRGAAHRARRWSASRRH